MGVSAKWGKALEIVKSNSSNSVLLFTCDKESTLLLELRGDLNIAVLFVDTGLYREEVYHYLELAEEYWGFKARILKDEKVIENSSAGGKGECYKLLMENIVIPYLVKHGIDTIIEPAKKAESSEEVKRIFPLSDFTDLEIWKIIKEKELPYCDLYNKGFRDVGCEPCSSSSGEGDMDQEEVKRRLKALGYL